MSSQYTPVAKQEDDLHQSLVGGVQEGLAPVASVPMMEVTAPATLPEGYEFDAAMGDRIVKVQVPLGGVEEGQKFSVPMPTSVSSMISAIQVPVGHWRDSLWSLWTHGVCHPHVWTSMCCTTLAAGQIIARMKLTWQGKEGTVAQTTGAFNIIFAYVVCYYALYYSLQLLLTYLDPELLDEEKDVKPSDISRGGVIVASVMDVVRYTGFILLFILLRNVRQTVRAKYAIPAREYEDCLCSVACPCLVAAQMLRHTTDYEAYPATCCTETGVPPSAPSIV